MLKTLTIEGQYIDINLCYKRDTKGHTVGPKGR